jgi:hypothetical protein
VSDPSTLQPTCPPLHRPEALFATSATVQGLRAAQVRTSGGSLFLDVWLYQDPPATLAHAAVWTLTARRGTSPVSIIDPVTIVASPTPHLELPLDGAPDAMLYRLEVVDPPPVDFDPLRSFLPVRLRPECTALGSCFSVPPAPAPPPPSPVQDYLARDWRSLRQALAEYLLREHPDADLSSADPTVTVLELFAHVGDLLNYRLDRVATEAYLETARLRTSVRRHARLVDYQLGEAVSARTFVHVAVAPTDGSVAVSVGEVVRDADDSALAFTVDEARTAWDSLGEIPIYDWGENACCLPAGATECVLVRPKPADSLGDGWLAPGDRIAFEVVYPGDLTAHAKWATRQQDWPVVSPAQGLRDPVASRTAQVVQLTAVDPISDPLLGTGLPLYRVAWSQDDALAESYEVGIDDDRGTDEVTIVRANLVAVHQGLYIDPGGFISRDADGYSLVSAGAPSSGGPGLALDETGRPHRLDVTVTLPSGAAVGALWVDTLLDPQVSVTDFPYVVDVEEQEPPILRFRTGSVGLEPPTGSTVSAAYEVGGGAIGNVPANALDHIDLGAGGTVPARNPAAATGGADPVVLADARRDAPDEFAAELLRAVIPADYATAADKDPAVQRAIARRTWTGSWPLVTTVVDLDADGDDVAQEALTRLGATLDGLRMLGVESAAVEGTPVGLAIALEVCPSPGFDPATVQVQILQLLRPGTDASPGLFHHSRMLLGASVYLSAVLAAVAELPGVDAVEPTDARRLSEPEETVHDVIAVAPDEIAVLDDDPSRPERGRLDVTVKGVE